MSRDALKAALEALPDPTHCEGILGLTERLALALPDGDVGALDDARFVDWLLAHSEDAPFGHGGETKRDKDVRDAKRLVARGNVVVAGFDPAAVIPEIEATLSPRMHLDATLVDVIVYPKGGMFAKHKDTPRTKDLIGTLVVGLPIAHEGGAFELSDGFRDPIAIDWSGTPNTSFVRWVALFSDIDHEVKPVTNGARVTLIYALAVTDRPRADSTRDQRLAKLRAAASAIQLGEAPLMISCTRLVITDGTQPQSIEALRGTDREIAETLVECALDVKVRACLVGHDPDAPFPPNLDTWAITRLAKPIPPEVLDQLDDEDSMVSFTNEADGDEGDEGEFATLLGDFVEDYVGMENWIVRTRTAGVQIFNGVYSETGYFGNEASIGLLYTFAALEVTNPAKPG